MIKEPKSQAFIWPSHHGWYFVHYNDDAISGLMTRGTARDYAEMFGGVVKKHSMAPKWWEFWHWRNYGRTKQCLKEEQVTNN